MFLGIAPVRISFAGGGTDIPEYYEQFGGHVITTCISRFVYVFLNERQDNSFQAFSPDFEYHQKPISYEELKPKNGTEIAVSVLKYLDYKQGVDIFISSDVPPGSGLGASGALAVNLVNTISSLKGKELPQEEVAETAYHIGRNILNWPIGKQDEYATSFGGFNYIKFKKEKTIVEPINMNSNSMIELQQNLLLFFVGKTRNSSIILSSQIKQTKEKNSHTVDALHTVNDLCSTMLETLKNNEITKFGNLLHKGWLAKKRFAEGVSNEFIDRIYDAAMKHGAMGGKLTGAGGGGHLLLYCEVAKQPALISHLENLGLKLVKFGFHNEGPKLKNLYDFINI